MPNVLYICYFGIREPLVQTQVLPYLRELVKIEGLRMSLVTFEPKSEAQELQNNKVASDLKNQLAGQGIDWHWLRYHKRLSVIATAWDIFCGTWFTWRFVAREKVDLIHARVQVPMLMAALGRKFSRRKPKLLFDIRGFFPEEYVDAGIWPRDGWLYRTAKRIEKWLLQEADGFVVLTEKAREILFPESLATGSDKRGRAVEVIPCCIDPARFSPTASRDAARMRLNVEGRFVIAYVGSFGGWYLTDDMMDLFAAARAHNRNTFVLVLTQRNPEKVLELLMQRGFGSDDILVKTVEPERLADDLIAGDIALSFIRECYSKLSSSPTKIAEYLACGLPVLTNRGIGDVDELIKIERVGVLLDGFTAEDYVRALEEMARLSAEAGIGERCRAVAHSRFNLAKIGGERYRSIYKQIIGDV